MRLKFQEVLIKPTEIATVNTGPFVAFGGFTYIPLQTASDFDWIFQVISRYILLKENHCFIEWALNRNSNPGLWMAVQKANKQSGGKGLSPPPSSSQGLQPSAFDRNRNQWQLVRARRDGWAGSDLVRTPPYVGPGEGEEQGVVDGSQGRTGAAAPATSLSELAASQRSVPQVKKQKGGSSPGSARRRLGSASGWPTWVLTAISLQAGLKLKS